MNYFKLNEIIIKNYYNKNEKNKHNNFKNFNLNFI